MKITNSESKQGPSSNTDPLSDSLSLDEMGSSKSSLLSKSTIKSSPKPFEAYNKGGMLITFNFASSMSSNGLCRVLAVS